MELLYLFFGLFIGMILGAGIALVYIQRKMRKQLGNLDREFEQMMEMTQGLMEEEEMKAANFEEQNEENEEKQEESEESKE